MNYGYEFVADNNASNRAYNVNGQSQEFNFTNTAMIKSPALTGDQRQMIGAHPNAISDPSNWAAFTGHLAISVIDGKVTESQMTAKRLFIKKWNLTATVDSDGDGFTDAVSWVKAPMLPMLTASQPTFQP